MICSSKRLMKRKEESVIRDFTVDEIRVMPYPDAFEKRLRECAIQQDETTIRVDILSCYEKLRREYRNVELSRAEQERVTEYRKKLTTISVNGIMLKQRHPAGLHTNTVQVIAPNKTPINKEKHPVAATEPVQSVQSPEKAAPESIKYPENGELELRTRPEISLKNLWSVASALFFGSGIETDRRKRRLEICRSCDLLVFDEVNKVARCGICGCKLSGKENLVDLLRFEETDQYGCKHPTGSKWKKAGV